ncbi:hypothetical protein D9M72_500930 [compost metagenome]
MLPASIGLVLGDFELEPLHHDAAQFGKNEWRKIKIAPLIQCFKHPCSGSPVLYEVLCVFFAFGFKFIQTGALERSCTHAPISRMKFFKLSLPNKRTRRQLG